MTVGKGNDQVRPIWLRLVRHTAVEERYQGVCYGASDVALSEAGLAHAEDIAVKLAIGVSPGSPTPMVIHSGLTRARHLADAIAAQCGCSAVTDARLAEFNFGTWELRSWAEIYLETGDDMTRLISEPDTYGPPGGETASAMRDRVWEWFTSLPRAVPVIAVSHGGPISALRGTLAGKPAHEWPQLIPAHGEIVEVREDAAAD